MAVSVLFIPWWRAKLAVSDFIFSANCRIGSLRFNLLCLCSLSLGKTFVKIVELALFLCKVSIQWGPAVQGTCELPIESSLLAEYIVQLYAPRCFVHYPARRAPPISCNRLSIPTSHESLLQTRETSASLPHQSFLDNTTSSLGLVNTMCWSEEIMRGDKQRNITPGRSQKAQGNGVETGLVKRGPGRPRKNASMAFATHAPQLGRAS